LLADRKPIEVFNSSIASSSGATKSQSAWQNLIDQEEGLIANRIIRASIREGLPNNSTEEYGGGLTLLRKLIDRGVSLHVIIDNKPRYQNL